MNIQFTKESFGPFRITAVKVIEPKAKHESGGTMQEYYLALGALYEAERTPSSSAEKLFWTEKDSKGKLVRGEFKRNQIPATEDARKAIAAAFEAAGYSDVSVEVREVKESGPAWKSKVAGLASMVELELDTREGVITKVKALAAKLGVDEAEVVKHAEACMG